MWPCVMFLSSEKCKNIVNRQNIQPIPMAIKVKGIFNKRIFILIEIKKGKLAISNSLKSNQYQFVNV